MSTPVELVDQLVGVGRLEVVQSSNLWGPALKLGKGWRPLKQGYQAPESVRFASADRSLSPAFCHADDAVRHVHEQGGDASTGDLAWCSFHRVLPMRWRACRSWPMT